MESLDYGAYGAMMHIGARLRRWWHCLTRMHCGLTFYDEAGRVLCIGCHCGRYWFMDATARRRSDES